MQIEPWELSKRIVVSEKAGFDCFESEEGLCDYIENNHKLFCRDILEEDFVSYEREWDLNKHRRFGPRPARIDFMFETRQSSCVLVECKNPHYEYTDLRNALSQLMAYSTICKKNDIDVDRRIIVSSRFDPIISEIMEDFNLPFELYLLGRNSMLKLMEQSEYGPMQSDNGKREKVFPFPEAG